MRKESTKHRTSRLAAQQPRQDLLEEVDRCEWCGSRTRPLSVHEILRGSLRSLSQAARFAQLVLCEGEGGCHALMGGRPLAEQLAILKRSRPAEFDLEAFWGLANRRYPYREDVDRWTSRLTFVPAL